MLHACMGLSIRTFHLSILYTPELQSSILRFPFTDRSLFLTTPDPRGKRDPDGRRNGLECSMFVILGGSTLARSCCLFAPAVLSMQRDSGVIRQAC